jgi:hypothetical protein
MSDVTTTLALLTMLCGLGFVCSSLAIRQKATRFFAAMTVLCASSTIWAFVVDLFLVLLR